MRAFFAAVLVVAPVGFALAEEQAKAHLASEAEIRRVLRGNANLEPGKSGYEFREGSKVGYKISDGKVCVFQTGKSSYFTIYSEAGRLDMVDSKGNRDFLN